MNYLSEMLKLPVLDVDGEKLGVVNDFGIATGEVFPHVTSLAFRGPGKTPFMISWRKWVDRIDETGVHLKSPATEIRFRTCNRPNFCLPATCLTSRLSTRRA